MFTFAGEILKVGDGEVPALSDLEAIVHYAVQQATNAPATTQTPTTGDGSLPSSTTTATSASYTTLAGLIEQVIPKTLARSLPQVTTVLATSDQHRTQTSTVPLAVPMAEALPPGAVQCLIIPTQQRTPTKGDGSLPTAAPTQPATTTCVQNLMERIKVLESDVMLQQRSTPMKMGDGSLPSLIPDQSLETSSAPGLTTTSKYVRT